MWIDCYLFWFDLSISFSMQSLFVGTDIAPQWPLLRLFYSYSYSYCYCYCNVKSSSEIHSIKWTILGIVDNILKKSTSHCNLNDHSRCCTTQHNTVQCSAVRCGAVRYNTIHYNTRQQYSIRNDSIKIEGIWNVNSIT